ncbi:MAG: 4-hydroxy-tetrahydrodipicolinate synthase [Saprospiraceae bacterium]
MTRSDTMLKFKGTGVALVTPFHNGKVDFPALERVIEHVIEGGVEYIVSLGSTGEATTLFREECKEIFRFTVKQVNGRMPLVAGLFGANSTGHLLERLELYADALEGFDAMMSSSPSYVKPSQEGIFQHYMALEKEAPLPIIIYNVPGRTSSNVAAETTLRLANASDKFMAVKEASGNMDQAQKIIKYKPNNFLVLSGDDLLTLGMVACGADGVISVIANAFPAQFSDMTRAALAGDFGLARRLHYELFDIHPWLYTDGNPAGIKAVMEMLGLCKQEVRLPLTTVSENTFQKLKKEVEKVARVLV